MTEDLTGIWVVGSEYYGDKLSGHKDGTTVAARLVRQPLHVHDSNAVAVFVRGAQVGNISAYKAEKILRWIDSVGGTLETTLTYRGSGADVFVPEIWLARPPQPGKVNVQQPAKFQDELGALGIGDHKCKVAVDGDQLNVTVGGVVIGRLHPRKLDQSTLDKIVHNRQQKLVIEESSYTDGLYARILLPAEKAPQPSDFLSESTGLADGFGFREPSAAPLGAPSIEPDNAAYRLEGFQAARVPHAGKSTWFVGVPVAVLIGSGAISLWVSNGFFSAIAQMALLSSFTLFLSSIYIVSTGRPSWLRSRGGRKTGLKLLGVSIVVFILGAIISGIAAS